MLTGVPTELPPRVIARGLHRNVVGGTEPNRMPMACVAMWKLWRQQGSIQDKIIRTTDSGPVHAVVRLARAIRRCAVISCIAGLPPKYAPRLMKVSLSVTH